MERRWILRLVAPLAAAACGARPEDWQERLREAATAGRSDQIEAALRGGASPDFVYTRILPSLNGAGGTSVETPLTLAVRSRSAEAVGALLHGGANPNRDGQCGGAALYLAVSDGRPDVADILLRAGAKDLPGRPCVDGRESSLIRAVRGGLVELTRRLLEAGSDPSGRDSCGATALHHAAAAGNRELILLLAPKAAGSAGPAWGSDRCPLSGLTPLMVAARRNDATAVELLLANGARSFWRDSQGRLAFEMTNAPALARSLREAYLRDRIGLEQVAEAAPIDRPLPLLQQLISQLPEGSADWNGVRGRLMNAVRWLRGRPGWERVPEDYRHSLTAAVYWVDAAARDRSATMLWEVYRDLELKQKDCADRGPGKAGNDVEFHVVTVAAPQTPSPGWIVRFRHALDFRKGEWPRFADPTDALQPLPPGPYQMYVERPDKSVKSCPENVAVTFRQNRFTFVAPVRTPAACQ